MFADDINDLCCAAYYCQWVWECWLNLLYLLRWMTQCSLSAVVVMFTHKNFYSNISTICHSKHTLLIFRMTRFGCYVVEGIFCAFHIVLSAWWRSLSVSWNLMRVSHEWWCLFKTKIVITIIKRLFLKQPSLKVFHHLTTMMDRLKMTMHDRFSDLELYVWVKLVQQVQLTICRCVKMTEKHLTSIFYFTFESSEIQNRRLCNCNKHIRLISVVCTVNLKT